jgi:hypothetical protein
MKWSTANSNRKAAARRAKRRAFGEWYNRRLGTTGLRPTMTGLGLIQEQERAEFYWLMAARSANLERRRLLLVDWLKGGLDEPLPEELVGTEILYGSTVYTLGRGATPGLLAEAQAAQSPPPDTL